MTITRGCCRLASSRASEPSEQLSTEKPAALSRYAIRSLLALLSSTTRIRSSLVLTMIPRCDKAEDASRPWLAGELDAAPEEPGEALADVESEPSAFPGRGAVLLELLECLEQ